MRVCCGAKGRGWYSLYVHGRVTILTSNGGMDAAAKDLLKRAVELDSAQRYSEAIICYEEGIQNILRVIRGVKDESGKKDLRKKAGEYLNRAEQIKELIKNQDVTPEKVQTLTIKEGDRGYSYAVIFDRCLDGNVTWVEVEDPYIKARHQLQNFVRFCELVVRKCRKISRVHLTTILSMLRDTSENVIQSSAFSELERSMREHGVQLDVTYSPNLHDRAVRFSNGWIVKLGRGLDIFHKPKGAFTIGFNDYDLRPCHETTIEIFHKLNTKKM